MVNRKTSLIIIKVLYLIMDKKPQFGEEGEEETK